MISVTQRLASGTLYILASESKEHAAIFSLSCTAITYFDLDIETGPEPSTCKVRGK